MTEVTGQGPSIREVRTDRGDVLRVDPMGGRIAEVTLGNTLILGSFIRGDGKVGNTHPCTPLFDEDKKKVYGLKRHGETRGEMGDVRLVDGKIVTSHVITDEDYPSDVLFEQEMGIEKVGEDSVFTYLMRHINNGDKEAAEISGVHNYMNAPNGYKGTTINGEDVTEGIERNEDGFIIDLRETNIIVIPGKNGEKPTKIELKQKGFEKAGIWVGRKRDVDGNIIIDDEGKEVLDEDYIAIEPVKADPAGFGSKGSMIQPNETRTASFTLRKIE